MKIIVLNGSPKGNSSITLQHVKFIQNNFPQYSLKIFDISEDINEIEKDSKVFQGIIDDIRAADGVLWAFPVYYFLVPSQYKRFIELIWERSSNEVFRGKYTAVLTTSVHFYDHAAHEYMNSICDDLEMKYVDSFSAGMGDFFKKEQRDKLYIFAEKFFEAIEKNKPVAKRYNKFAYTNLSYYPGKPGGKIDIGDKKILIVTDLRKGQENLGKMIERFRSSFSRKCDMINLDNINIKGGCMGCIHCGFDNNCIYDRTDGYSEFYNKILKNSDIIVFAGSIKDRYLSSRWKLFFDRSFFYNHVPSLSGKQMGFLISGPLRQLSNLRQILDAYVECMQSNMAGFVTDEYENSEQIDSLLQDMARRLVDYSELHYIRPYTCLSIGGRKVLRDEIWERLRFIFQADDRYYKKYGLYDFPQKNIRARFFNDLIILITKIPFVRKKIMGNIKEKMVEPYKKILGKEAAIRK